jgi:hypothetical protein
MTMTYDYDEINEKREAVELEWSMTYGEIIEKLEAVELERALTYDEKIERIKAISVRRGEMLDMQTMVCKNKERCIEDLSEKVKDLEKDTDKLISIADKFKIRRDEYKSQRDEYKSQRDEYFKELERKNSNIFKINSYEWSLDKMHISVEVIDKMTTKAELKKLYKQLSGIYHPDKITGSNESMKDLSKAFEIVLNKNSQLR